ncbi:MAG TPA: glycosyltransferase [Gammaproteobacteria bacterium]
MRGVERIVSVCRWLPTPDDPTAGLFVQRRLEALGRLANVEVLQPIPYFPGLRNIPAWARTQTRSSGALAIHHQPMFYLPKVMKSLDGYWLYRSIRRRVGRTHAERRIDAIDAHFGYPDGVGAARAARRLGIPYFVTFRGLEADYVDDPLIAPQIRDAVTHAAGCVCVAHFLRDVALRYGAEPSRVGVIHNAVDRSLFRPGSRAEARAALSIAADCKLVVSVGHLLSVKGHRTLIAAFAAVRARLPTARLVIVGGAAHEPDHPAELAAQVRALGLGDAVTFVGKLPPREVVRWLRAADTFALASRREGCCNAVLEALAAGVPVVATAVGDNPYFVEEGANGYLVPVDHVDALAAALEAVLTRGGWDPDRISASLRAGEWSEVARQVLDFFRERLQDLALDRPTAGTGLPAQHGNQQ